MKKSCEESKELAGGSAWNLNMQKNQVFCDSNAATVDMEDISFFCSWMSVDSILGGGLQEKHDSQKNQKNITVLTNPDHPY